MAREGIQICDETFLRNVKLPAQTNSYTVISHGYIIDKVRTTLQENNFEIENEEYSYSYGGEVALCKILIKSAKDPDMGMLFTWWNSYNKSVKFGCAIGGFIYDNKTSLIGSEGMMWVRKHTGTADEESKNIIEQLISQAEMYFDKIIVEKNRMKQLPLSVETFGCIMGAMYFELDLITPNQASCIKNEYKKPLHQYKDKDTLWGLYKLLMFGIDESDLRKWANIQQKIHYTIMNEYAIATEDQSSESDTKSLEESVEIDMAVAPTTTETVIEIIPSPSNEATCPATEFIEYMINSTTYDKALIDYFVGNHMDVTQTQLSQNIEAFIKWNGKPLSFKNIEVPTNSLTDEELDLLIKEDVHVGPPEMYLGDALEMDTSEADMSKVTSVAPDVAGNFTLKEETVESIDPVAEITERMKAHNPESYKELEGSIKDIENTLVFGDDAPEVAPERVKFAIDETEDIKIHVESDQEYLERVAEIEGEQEEVVAVKEENKLDNSKVNESVAEVKVPEGFEWLLEDDDLGEINPIDSSIELMKESLEIPAETKQLAKDIEEKMKRLYGKLSPYSYVEGNDIVVITLDETQEVFYIKTN